MKGKFLIGMFVFVVLLVVAVSGADVVQPMILIQQGDSGDVNLTNANFTDLHDTPSTYSGKALYSTIVNAGETALEFFDIRDWVTTNFMNISETFDGINETFANETYLRQDGSTPLTSDWDIGNTRKILADEIIARDSAGLKLFDDDGNGLFIEDGGDVKLGTNEITADSFIYNDNKYGLSWELPNKRNMGLAALGKVENMIRGRPIRSTEYWDGSAWQTWAGSNITNLIDGDFTSYLTIPQAYTTGGWRFSVSGMNWKRTFAIGINKGYGSGTFSLPYTLLWETSSDEISWTTRKSWDIGTGITGYQDVMFDVAENGDQYWRFTIEFDYNTHGDAYWYEFAIYGTDPAKNPAPLQWTGRDDARFKGKLELGGDLTLKQSSQADIYMEDTSGVLNEKKISLSNYEGNFFIRSYNDDGSTKSTPFWVDADGSVVFGGDLEVKSTIPKIILTDTNGRDLEIKTDSTSIYYDVSSGSNARFREGTTTNLFIESGGNVGIGTDTPSEKLDVQGNIALTGSMDGRNIATDGTKLDTIETSADVTDSTNVANAGAVMDSGDETIAGVKTFSSFPITPSSAPTTDYQIANKKYVDDNGGVGGSATQEFFVQPFDSGSTYVTVGDNSQWGVVRLSSLGSTSFNFIMPNDFSSLTDADIVILPDTTETIQWDLDVGLGAVGEDKDAGINYADDTTQPVTADIITELDISNKFTGITANDYVSINFQSDTSYIRVIGLRIKYN